MRVGEVDGFTGAFLADVAIGFAGADGFEFDHLGAVVGHHLRQQRSRQEQRQVEHANAP